MQFIKKISAAFNVREGLAEVILNVTKLLKENNIDYAIIGGIAAGYWSEPRHTNDIDFLTPKSNRSKLEELFKTQPLSMETREGITAKIDDVDVDFIFSDNEENFLYDNKASHLGFSILDRNQLIYLKLASARTKDVSDIVQICKKMSNDIRESFIQFLSETNLPLNDKEEYLESFNTACIIADLEDQRQNKRAGKIFRTFMLRKLASKTN